LKKDNPSLRGHSPGRRVFCFPLFSKASIEHIRTGKVRTTGGTDFDCVIEHALKNHFRKIILITDGCADMTNNNVEKVRSGKLEVYLVLTERSSYLPEVLSTNAKGHFYLC